MRASGFKTEVTAALAVMTTTAAAPSLMPEALPAVTLPSCLNAGRSFIAGGGGSCAWELIGIEHDRRALALRDPDRHDFVLNLLSRIAAAALSWEAAEKASCSSREISHWAAMSRP